METAATILNSIDPFLVWAGLTFAFVGSVIILCAFLLARIWEYRLKSNKLQSRLVDGFTDFEVEMCLEWLVDQRLTKIRKEAEEVSGRFTDLKGLPYNEFVSQCPLRSHQLQQQVFAIINDDKHSETSLVRPEAVNIDRKALSLGSI